MRYSGRTFQGTAVSRRKNSEWGPRFSSKHPSAKDPDVGSTFREVLPVSFPARCASCWGCDKPAETSWVARPRVLRPPRPPGSELGCLSYSATRWPGRGRGSPSALRFPPRLLRKDRLELPKPRLCLRCASPSRPPRAPSSRPGAGADALGAGRCGGAAVCFSEIPPHGRRPCAPAPPSAAGLGPCPPGSRSPRGAGGAAAPGRRRRRAAARRQSGAGAFGKASRRARRSSWAARRGQDRPPAQAEATERACLRVCSGGLPLLPPPPPSSPNPS
ncbi:PREDICTED: translation initiation factor IF-2-like, partial [Chinchilla lanigera]|uniref:translation initiation factor IF-2-like n=1 Tax=Chinchilla lanigera TaxID=34839 RepID=UPI000695B792